MEDNRINFATHQIFLYANEMFVGLYDLVRPNIGEYFNEKSHGLSKEELIVLLHELFSKHMLVALQEERGLFTPALDEIEKALNESRDMMHRSKNTFYGITTGAMEKYHELQQMYGRAE